VVVGYVPHVKVCYPRSVTWRTRGASMHAMHIKHMH